MEFVKDVARVLVIDDNVPLANAFGKALMLAGYRVSIAHDATSALEDVGRHRPDAVVLDFQMPIINGVGFLYRFRANAAVARVPVIVITGHAITDELTTELRDLDAQLLRKPVGIADLVNAVRVLLEDHDTGSQQPGDH